MVEYLRVFNHVGFFVSVVRGGRNEHVERGSVMSMIDIAMGLGIALTLVVLYLLSCLRVLTEYERGVIFRLGRVMPEPKGPGLIMVFGPVDRMTAHRLADRHEGHRATGRHYKGQRIG